MNKADRVELQKAITMIDEARAIVESTGEREQEKFDNLTEGLQASERGQKFEELANSLAEVADSLGEAISTIETAME